MGDEQERKGEMDAEHIALLNNPPLAIRAALQLILSTLDEYDQAEQRNADLSVLAAGLHYRLMAPGETLQEQATGIKKTLVCAYLLGQRDAQGVPTIFREEG